MIVLQVWISWEGGNLQAGYTWGTSASVANTGLEVKYLAVKTDNECALIDPSKYTD